MKQWKTIVHREYKEDVVFEHYYWLIILSFIAVIVINRILSKHVHSDDSIAQCGSKEFYQLVSLFHQVSFLNQNLFKTRPVLSTI